MTYRPKDKDQQRKIIITLPAFEPNRFPSCKVSEEEDQDTDSVLSPGLRLERCGTHGGCVGERAYRGQIFADSRGVGGVSVWVRPDLVNAEGVLLGSLGKWDSEIV